MLLLIACTGSPEETGSSVAADAPALHAEAVVDGALQPLLLDAISGATRRIDVAQYTLYDSGAVSPLLDALISAAGRGVSVRVLADEAADDTEASLARLSAGGVAAKLDSPSVTTHTKLLIADDHTFLGSHNWSHSAMTANHEGSAMLWDPSVSAHYAAFFEALWEDPSADPALTWSADGPVTPLLNRAVHPALLACMAGAQSRIRVVMYAISDSPDWPDGEVAALVDALLAAAASGVDVGVVLDGSDWIVSNQINDHAIERLSAGGVEVWRAAPDTTTHAKVLLCDDVAIISDANWSFSALTAYHGASVRIEDAEVAAEIVAWWTTIQSTAGK